jgi:hypothetical protein
MKLKKFEVDEGEAEVTKTISLHDVYKHLDEWKDSLKGELESQYGKGCLIPIKGKDALILAKESGVELKTLPTKLVAVKKKKPNEPTKLKSRIVACGNYDESEEEKSTYAGGADATAVRTAIRRAALKKWIIRTKDVSTACLNADYVIEGEMLLLKPPYIYVKAGLIEADEYWLVKKAIYGLKESPLLWSKERDRKLAKIIIEVEKDGISEQYILKKLKSDPNTWHILKKGNEE